MKQTQFDKEEVAQIMRHEIQRSQSPWCDREAAAAYCACSKSEIDAAANRGDIKRYWRNRTPMFHKSGLDSWIERGRIPQKKIDFVLRVRQEARAAKLDKVEA